MPIISSKKKVAVNKVHEILDAIEQAVKTGWGEFEARDQKFYVLKEKQMIEVLQDED